MSLNTFGILDVDDADADAYYADADAADDDDHYVRRMLIMKMLMQKTFASSRAPACPDTGGLASGVMREDNPPNNGPFRYAQGAPADHTPARLGSMTA